VVRQSESTPLTSAIENSTSGEEVGAEWFRTFDTP
jgi:hypothetical protein